MSVKDRFPDWKKPEIKHNKPTVYNWVVSYPRGLYLSRYTDIGAYTYINARRGVIIDENVEIGSHCSLYSENSIDGTKGKIHLHKGCKIGSHSVIMPGVIIGENAVVGAFSLVKNHVLPNTVVVGIPAKQVNKKVVNLHLKGVTSLEAYNKLLEMVKEWKNYEIREGDL